eukprot:NODE_10022_length_248_cov_20.040201_g9281_i0.p1 GENE.NODE_10022_length_248_cov_20.040201_g9281_i0~~NODE_10022_length_248_cov_20.040201_g9281_i0.p1  ORF type:complete len:52 (+),score=7.91 NODE_10022_length_248_cov_20.040201_g9281_i0:90-245(+)
MSASQTSVKCLNSEGIGKQLAHYSVGGVPVWFDMLSIVELKTGRPAPCTLR